MYILIILMTFARINCTAEYTEKLMNEENEWDHGISAKVKEKLADCIRIGEVVAALKKTMRHKAQGLSGTSAEMIQATEGIGIVKEDCIPEDWKSSITDLQRER